MATQEEKDVVMDLVYQLEARNPNPDATNVNAVGERCVCDNRGSRNGGDEFNLTRYVSCIERVSDEVIPDEGRDLVHSCVGAPVHSGGGIIRCYRFEGDTRDIGLQILDEYWSDIKPTLSFSSKPSAAQKRLLCSRRSTTYPEDISLSKRCS